MKIKRSCLFCGDKFETEEKYVVRGHGKFCSRSCSSKYGNKIRERTSIEVECSYCNKTIKRKRSAKTKNFYCSRECKAKHEKSNNRLCVNCKQELNKRSQKKYCSARCQSEYTYNKYIEDWKSGKVDGGGESISVHVRKYLFDKYNNKCCKCGWSEKNPVSSLIPLTVDHKNGDPYDHREENLELICPNCHSLTPYYGGLNFGNGRRKRAEKLREYKMRRLS